jgi:hypothetical protein
MRTGFVFTLCVSLAALLSCGPVLSLQPFYTDKDVRFDEDLLGTWLTSSDDQQETLTLQKAANKSYDFDFESKANPLRLKAHLMKLGKYLFLDVYPRDRAKEFFVPVHSVFQLWQTGDTLRIAYLDNEWLGKMSKSGKLKVPHRVVEGTILFTASPAELQKFLVANATNASAWPDPGVLIRRR